jgi:hypothetical protein
MILSLSRKNNFIDGVVVVSSTGGTVHFADNIGPEFHGRPDPLFTSYQEKEFDGIVLRSPNGTRYQLMVDDSGGLITETL